MLTISKLTVRIKCAEVMETCPWPVIHCMKLLTVILSCSAFPLVQFVLSPVCCHLQPCSPYCCSLLLQKTHTSMSATLLVLTVSELGLTIPHIFKVPLIYCFTIVLEVSYNKFIFKSVKWSKSSVFSTSPLCSDWSDARSVVELM